MLQVLFSSPKVIMILMIMCRKFKQLSDSQTRDGEILTKTRTRTRCLTPPPTRSFIGQGQSKEWISPRQSKSTGKLLENQNYQFIKSVEAFHNNNNRTRTDRDLARLPTKSSNSSKDVKNSSCRVNTFKHVVQGSSCINPNMNDLRCKVPVTFKYLKPPNKSPTGNFKHELDTGTRNQNCVTTPDQEPRRSLRKAFNIARTPAATSGIGGRNNNHTTNKSKAGALNPESLLPSKSYSPVVNINTSLNLCRKCQKQVKAIL